MHKQLVFVLSILVYSSVFASEEADQAIHDELRTVLQGLEQAINEERYNDLAPYFHENLRVTTINQETISSREEIGQYFDRWFGPGGYLKKLDIKLRSDAKTELYGEKSFGIVRGSGDENYYLSDSRYYEMKIRWTATVVKDFDGKWRILSLHIGTNFLDNAILAEAEGALKYFTIGGFLAGIIVMIIFTFMLKRFRKT